MNIIILRWCLAVAIVFDNRFIDYFRCSILISATLVNAGKNDNHHKDYLQEKINLLLGGNKSNDFSSNLPNVENVPYTNADENFNYKLLADNSGAHDRRNKWQQYDNGVVRLKQSLQKQTFDENNNSNSLNEYRDYDEDNTDTDFYESLDEIECILGTADDYLAWWINFDGSLRKSSRMNDQEKRQTYLDLSRSPSTIRKIHELITNRIREPNCQRTVKYLSIAHNGLQQVPMEALAIVGETLEYLSLTGNMFNRPNTMYGEEPINWATFPKLLYLRELDIRNCSISVVDNQTFNAIPNLLKLYLSHNQLIEIGDLSLASVPQLIHLDLSHNNMSEAIRTIWAEDPYMQAVEGLYLPENVFADLTHLRFLDLSHTKIAARSVKALSSLAPSVIQLSLCFTGLPLFARDMFENTSIRALDISGNPSTAVHLHKDAFRGLADSLQVLSFQHSNIKSLHWIYHLRRLRILILNGNNINSLSNETFLHLPDIEVLDLGANHIGNWYSRLFQRNLALRVLNLRENNINIMSADMFADFERLELLAIGKNNFICSCILRDFIEIASNNNRYVNCTLNGIVSDILATDKNDTNSDTMYDVMGRVMLEYIQHMPDSRAEMNRISGKLGRFRKRRYFSVAPIKPFIHSAMESLPTTNGTEECLSCRDRIRRCVAAIHPASAETMSFRFQLIDFDEDDYRCINSTSNEELSFADIEPCVADRSGWPDFSSLRKTHNGGLLNSILITICVSVFVCLLIYANWWYIRYFCVLIKNATILSFLDKERTQTNADGEDYLYDLFVSYSDKDREWVLQELLPQMEQSRHINMCLHERDFEIGLSILENIISCMDRSRCLLLIVSQSFLLSQWCQFEMHLAQHRLVETRREQLILVLLEDIPKRKRPKTLQFLMRTKTYIRWPTEPEKGTLMEITNKLSAGKTISAERKLFWRRLKKAIVSADWEKDEQQSSHV